MARLRVGQEVARPVGEELHKSNRGPDTGPSEVVLRQRPNMVIDGKAFLSVRQVHAHAQSSYDCEVTVGRHIFCAVHTFDYFVKADDFHSGCVFKVIKVEILVVLVLPLPLDAYRVGLVRVVCSL